MNNSMWCPAPQGPLPASLFALWMFFWFLSSSALASQIDNMSMKNKMYTYRLPRVHVQFICHQNIIWKQKNTSSTFSVTDEFHDYYQQFLPNMSNTTLRHNLKSSTMRDIKPTSYYFNSCNMSSPQVLLTMVTEGWAQYHMDPRNLTTAPFNDTEFAQLMKQKVTPSSLETYFRNNVCQDMAIFRAYVDLDWSQLTPESFDEDPYLDHKHILLCGGERFVYDDDPDGGFYVFGIMVGVVMAAMLLGELQQFYQAGARARRTGNASSTSNTTSSGTRSRRRGSRRNRQREDYALTPTEVEMV